MSGYLTQLLRSTFDPSMATLQPRVSALFSPPEKVSAWSAGLPVSQQAETIWEGSDVRAGTAVPEFNLRRPLTRTANPVPEEQEDSSLDQPLPPPISFGPAAPANEEGTAQSQAVRSVPTKIGMREVPDSPHPEVAQIDTDSNASRITAKPLREKLTSPAKTGPHQDDHEERSSIIARAEQHSAKSEIGASLVGPRLRTSSEESPKERGRRSASSGRVQAPDQPRMIRTITSGTLRSDVGDAELPASQPETRKVLSAFPLSSTEDRTVAKHAEPGLAELDFGRSALSARPSQFREMGRRESQSAQLAEPTIEVTIGRIEVRGGTPAAPQRLSSQPTRGTNLDEYLRRRSGRSRE